MALKWKSLKKRKKRIVSVFLGILFLGVASICYLYFNAEHIQNKIKERIYSLVLENEDDLYKTVEECRAKEAELLLLREVQEDNDYGILNYKELNSKKVNKIFRMFRLWSIRQWEEDDVVDFRICPTVVSILWDNYDYGFYYTESDKAFDVFWDGKECDEETEGIIYGFGNYRYRTQQIDHHWWFYECKIYPIKR